MPEKVIMPKAGMAMETGTIIRWLKTEGERVERGEAILEIETDKLTMEVEAEASGVLLRILFENGSVVPVVSTIAWIGETGEAIPEQEEMPQSVSETETTYRESKHETSLPSPADRLFSDGKIAATPAARRLAKELGVDLADVQATGAQGEIKKRDVEAARRAHAATPLARHIAEKNRIDLREVEGTGPNAKIYSRDLKISDASRVDVEFAFSPIKRKRAPTSRETLKGMRKIIARHMTESHQTVPAATLRTEVDAEPIWRLRGEYNAIHGTKITFNDLVLKATALALDEFPEMNAFLDNEEITFNDSVHLGVAMAVDRGLLVPVIRNVDERTLREISEAVRDLSGRARTNMLKPDELVGGTFTVTNLGMYGITSFTPIVNLPQVAILGVCAIVETPVVLDGKVVPGRRMGLCLTHDHRWIDGAVGAAFLKRVRQLLENPVSLL